MNDLDKKCLLFHAPSKAIKHREEAGHFARHIQTAKRRQSVELVAQKHGLSETRQKILNTVRQMHRHAGAATIPESNELHATHRVIITPVHKAACGHVIGSEPRERPF